jgi:hypothetical protein
MRELRDKVVKHYGRNSCNYLVTADPARTKPRSEAAGRFPMRIVSTVIAVIAITAAHHASAAKRLSYEQIVSAVIKENRAAYGRDGERCICPYDYARDGQLCGRHSLYKKAGGRSPLCYAKNVGSGEIQRYFVAHPD